MFMIRFIKDIEIYSFKIMTKYTLQISILDKVESFLLYTENCFINEEWEFANLKKEGLHFHAKVENII